MTDKQKNPSENNFSSTKRAELFELWAHSHQSKAPLLDDKAISRENFYKDTRGNDL